MGPQCFRTAVQDRLVKEINYWTHRYEQLKLDVDSGKQPRMRPENAKRRATELSDRPDSNQGS